MSFTIHLYKMEDYWPSFATAVALSAVMAFLAPYGRVYTSAGVLFAAAGCYFLWRRLLLPYNRANTTYVFTPEKLTQFVWGRRVKEIGLGEGLMVYRKDARVRSHLVFSRVEIPQAANLREWRKNPEAIIIPYVPRKMPNLKRYDDKAKMI